MTYMTYTRDLSICVRPLGRCQNLFTAIKSSRNVLQPSGYHCWATFLVLFRDTPLATIGRTLADGQMAINGQIWPKWLCCVAWLKVLKWFHETDKSHCNCYSWAPLSWDYFVLGQKIKLICNTRWSKTTDMCVTVSVREGCQKNQVKSLVFYQTGGGSHWYNRRDQV